MKASRSQQIGKAADKLAEVLDLIDIEAPGKINDELYRITDAVIALRETLETISSRFEEIDGR